MYSFFFKKNFYDGWDNILSIIVVNLIIIALCTGIVSLMYIVQNYTIAVLALILVGFIAISILNLAFGELAAKIANFESAHLSDFFRSIPSCIKDGVFFGLLCGAIVAISYICIPFYFSQNKMLTTIVGAMFLWIVIFTILSLQWFVAIRSLLHNNFKKCLKKSFIIFFDNVGFSFFMAIYTLFLFVLSIFPFIFILPSVSGITLSYTNALRLRLYKYDYLDSHPELKTPKERKYIPWEQLLENDKDTLGPRTIKSVIFSWKD